MKHFKKIIISLLLCQALNIFGGIDNESIGNEKLLNNKNYLIGLCKVWGALKYYSLYISENNIDWDSVLVKQIKNCPDNINKASANAIYNEWLQNFTQKNFLDKTIKIKDNKRAGWINDTALFTTQTVNNLRKLTSCKTNFNNRYCTPVMSIGNYNFEKENTYENMDFPSVEYRLLALFRLWNVINYFYPHLEIIDSDWNKVLEKHIAGFISCHNRFEYLNGINNMMILIDDSHFILLKDLAKHKYFPLFKLNYVADTTYVKYPDSSQNIYIGDIICKIDGVPIKDVRKKIYDRMGGGNDAVINYYVNLYLLSGEANRTKLTIIRNNDTINIPYNLSDGSKIKQIKNINSLCVKTDSQFTYINLSTINTNVQLDSIVVKNINTPNLIFDLRHGLEVV